MLLLASTDANASARWPVSATPLQLPANHATLRPMTRLLDLAARVDREVYRARNLLTIAGWLCFALITADYAGFIALPTLVTVPLWLGIVVSLLRWALWEGMVKPRINTHDNHREGVGTLSQPSSGSE